MLPEIPAETPVWAYIVCMSAAVLVIGIAKAGFGGGIGVIAVPLMAVALPVDQTLGVMLPILIAGDVFSLAHHRGHDSRKHAVWLVTGAVVGIIAGTIVLIALRESGDLKRALNLIIGAVCLIFVAIQCYRLAGGHVPHISPRPIAGRITGFAAGAVSTLTHAAGPIITIYLLEQKLAKRLLVGTAVAFTFAGNLLKLPTYFGLGLMNPGTLLQSLWCLPLIPVGTVTGMWMHNRVNERFFSIIMYAGAAAAAGHMLYKALG